jgi:hypothetical protein
MIGHGGCIRSLLYGLRVFFRFMFFGLEAKINSRFLRHPTLRLPHHWEGLGWVSLTHPQLLSVGRIAEDEQINMRVHVNSLTLERSASMDGLLLLFLGRRADESWSSTDFRLRDIGSVSLDA